MENSGEKYFTKAIEALTNPKPPLKPLPVAAKVPEILESVQDKKVTIVTADTGSGKTLLANTALADATDDPVWVLVPRRFLAINAAETIAKLSGKKLGEEVGYAIGNRSSGRSLMNQNGKQSKLIYATYGYALSSGLLDDPNTKTIVCDEVHEKGLDISLARAIIHRRLKRERDELPLEKRLNLVEMSATINEQRQADYWSDVAQTSIHRAQGNSFDCDYREVAPPQPEKSEDDKGKKTGGREQKPDWRKVKEAADKAFLETITGLLKEVDETTYTNAAPDNQQKGIAVFLDGVKEVEGTAAALRAEYVKNKVTNVEVAVIYADMDHEQRKEALAPPKEGNLKILVGTNVIESGMNIPWLRGGVSNGKTKIPYYNFINGAKSLDQEELPEWRITQQIGRVNRFDIGKFILFSDLAKDKRPKETSAEISRISLHNLAMYAANYGIDPTTLKFDAGVQEGNLVEAKKDLFRLQLMDEEWRLTEQGEFAMRLSVGPEVSAMLWAAKERFPELMNDAIELAAVAEVMSNRGMAPIVPPSVAPDKAKAVAASKKQTKGGEMRADMRLGHGGKAAGADSEGRIGHGMDNGSDVLDALKAYRVVAVNVEKAMAELFAADQENLKAYRAMQPVHGEVTEDDCHFSGISLSAYQDIRERERAVLEDCCAQKNISVMRFKEVRELISDMQRRLENDIPENAQPLHDVQKIAPQLIQMILHGSVNRLFVKYVGTQYNQKTREDEKVVMYSDPLRGQSGHRDDKYSVTGSGRSDAPFAVSHLREITEKGSGKTTVYAGNLTRVTDDALTEFLAQRPDIVRDVDTRDDTFTASYFGGDKIELPIHKRQSAAMRDLLAAKQGLTDSAKPRFGDATLHGAEPQRQSKPAKVLQLKQKGPAKTPHSKQAEPVEEDISTLSEDRKFRMIEQLLEVAMVEWCDTYHVDPNHFKRLSQSATEVTDQQLSDAEMTRDDLKELLRVQDRALQAICVESGMTIERFHELKANPPAGSKPTGKVLDALEVTPDPVINRTLGGGQP